jgi:hypothetical protein
MPVITYSGVTVVLQWCYSGVTVVYDGVTLDRVPLAPCHVRHHLRGREQRSWCWRVTLMVLECNNYGVRE